ncbi:MAG: hypothetical protein IJA48_00170 [Oscillospiraceae bacterium]|nr:hypothetical protein [Oscillospiraceae bacterium]
MVKELYQIKQRETALNITDSRVDSVRRKNITKTGCRVYENGCIGIAGVLGEPTEATWEKAEAALSAAVPYPYAPCEGAVRMRELGKITEDRELIAKTELLLETLRKEFPGYVYSNKVYSNEVTTLLKNDLGLCLEDIQRTVTVVIVVKEECSANVYDTVIAWIGREYDLEAVLRTARQILSAHSNPVALPEGRIPVLMRSDMASDILSDYLDVQKLKKGASLLSGKEGEQLFSPEFNLVASRKSDTYSAFFDAEGMTLPDDRLPLIESGILLRGIADKKYASEYEAENTACAGGDYDDVPSLDAESGTVSVKATGTLEQLLGAQDAIYVAMASGGDITPSGDYATPVQTAYLLRGGKLVGKLPELNFRGNIFDLLGKDYLGCSSDRPFDDARLLAVYGELSK